MDDAKGDYENALLDFEKAIQMNSEDKALIADKVKFINKIGNEYYFRISITPMDTNIDSINIDLPNIKNIIK